MSLEITGSIHMKGDTQQVSDKFRKREFILELVEEINGNIYTNYAKMQLVQAKCDILDRFSVGDKVKVSFNLKGNRVERSDKVNYITNLDVWRIEVVQGGYANTNNASSTSVQAPAPNYNPSPSTIDDLPF